MRRKIGDRRSRPRFDVVGALWGTVETVMWLPMENIGRGGALIRSHVQLTPDSIHRMTVRAGDRDFTSQVKVRHVRASTTADGEQCFLIGIEFLSLPLPLLAQIDAWAVGTGEPSEV